MVIDSTDRERLGVIKEELFKMLAHEVRPAALSLVPSLRCVLILNPPLTFVGPLLYAHP
jgi:hypothetical protein